MIQNIMCVYVYIYNRDKEREREREICSKSSDCLCVLAHLLLRPSCYVRNLPGWLETRLARISLDYLIKRPRSLCKID